MTFTLEQMEAAANTFLAIVRQHPGITSGTIARILKILGSPSEEIQSACDFACEKGLLFRLGDRYFISEAEAARAFDLYAPPESAIYILCAASEFVNKRPDHVLSDAETDAEVLERARILEQFAAEAKLSIQQNRFATYLFGTNKALADPARRQEFIEAVISLLSDVYNWRGDQPKGKMSDEQFQEIMSELRRQHEEYKAAPLLCSSCLNSIASK
jgi:hypothetical protein